jgi:hypothetical protein
MTEYTQEDAARDFELKLQRASPKVRDEYHRLLVEKQVESAKKSEGHAVTVSTEEREELFKQADTNIYVGHVDPQKMNKDWENASHNGRPPIGGAKND